MKIKKVFFFALLATFFFAASQAYGVVAGPTDQLKPTLDKLVSILADPALKGDTNKLERRQKIMSTIDERFDFREMTKLVVGRIWREIDEKEKEQVTVLMTKLLENNYIGQLENYSGQKIEYVGERIKKQKRRALVSTLLAGKTAKYPVHYIMVEKGEGWFVFDINIEGVSLIKNYRKEFQSIIKREKFEGLVKALEKKNEFFETQ